MTPQTLHCPSYENPSYKENPVFEDDGKSLTSFDAENQAPNDTPSGSEDAPPQALEAFQEKSDMTVGDPPLTIGGYSSTSKSPSFDIPHCATPPRSTSYDSRYGSSATDNRRIQQSYAQMQPEALKETPSLSQMLSSNDSHSNKKPIVTIGFILTVCLFIALASLSFTIINFKKKEMLAEEVSLLEMRVRRKRHYTN